MRFTTKSALLASTLIACGFSIAHADSTWIAAPDHIDGSLRAGSREVPVQPGDETQLLVRRVPAGASITVLHGAELLTPEPMVADDKGTVSIPIKVPADAEPGNHPLTVISQNPPGVTLVNLKLSKIVPPLDVEGFELATIKVGERAYQSAVSAGGKLFVASARGPNEESRLIRIDAKTLKPEAEAKIAASADAKDGLVDVFGVAVDNAHGRVWTTNTLNETVSVYDANDLSAVKVFEEGSVGHPRDVVIDEAAKRAYVSIGLGSNVAVYDTETLERLDDLTFEVKGSRERFASMTLSLDVDKGRLYSISRETPWVSWIDLKTGKSTGVEVPGMLGGSGISHDPETGNIWLTAQDSNNVILLDEAGKVLADTYVGAGGVSIVWNPVTKQAYATTRAGGTVAVLDENARLVANLPIGDVPNEITVAPDGAVYAVAMYGTPNDDDKAGSVTRITPKD